MKLPALKSYQVLRALYKAGFVLDHQTGSHAILYNSATKRRVSVPMHGRDLKKGTLKNIIHQAGLMREEFEKLLR
jgi:predicted RNA binding protein YcfA (HicA-like mRNA interferase family)